MPREQALVDHPLVVVDLGEIAGAGVADEADDALRPLARAAVAQRRGEQRAGRRAAEDAFGAQQLARRAEALGVVDRVGHAHARQVGDRGDEVLADALHRPRAGGADRAAAGVLGDDRAGRIGEHEAELGAHRAEEARQAGDRAARADAADDGVDVLPHLRPDLRAGGALVRQRVGGIVELVGEERAGDLAGEPGREILVVGGMALADVGAGDVHLGAERLQVQHLLGRHLVGHDQDDAIALGPRHQRQAEAGVAGGRLDHGAAGLQAAVALGGIDHRQADPVLDRAAGVLRFELQEQRAGAGVEPRHAHQRRVADELENGRGGGRHAATVAPTASAAERSVIGHRQGFRSPTGVAADARPLQRGAALMV